MTHYCGKCLVNWAPYMTNKGACPQCGGGTIARNEAMTDDAKPRYAVVIAKRQREELYRRFEEYYAKRELERGPDAWLEEDAA